jgi:hypothetical protein
MRRIALLLAAAACLPATIGCGGSDGSQTTSEAAPAAGWAAEDDASENGAPTIEVPDATGQDGWNAVSDIEAEGLVPALEDANGDPNFDIGRDADGCEVLDQDPAAGTELEEGGEVILAVDCRQVDWDNQEGSVWDDFDSAYLAGFEDGCDALFAMSPDGYLYEDDDEYTVFDCTLVQPSSAADASDLSADFPEDPQAEGAALGALDACQMMFWENFISSLSYGEDTVSDLDCESIASTVAAPPPPPRRTKRPARSEQAGAGRTCSGTLPDGAPVQLEISRGEVSCERATDLWAQYMRRAPAEGQGSAAYVAVDGWSCATSPPSREPRLGSCVNLSDDTEFVAYAG